MTRSQTSALICDVQRFSVHDGAGIRTAVFFKGCPLRCAWCHNPEAIAFDNQPLYTASACIGCGDCVEACPQRAIAVGPGGIERDHARCQRCLRCADVCPSRATRAAARPLEPAQLLAEVCRDSDFYGDRGGITLSGGEPLVHASYLATFLPLATQRGLDVVVETAGQWRWSAVRPLLRHIDRFLYDIKILDPARHRELCGGDNAQILANLQRLVAHGARVTPRLPVVIGATADSDNMERAAQLLASLHLGQVTLLPYHRLGEEKWSGLGLARQRGCFRAPTPAELDRAEQPFRARRIEVLYS